MATVAGMTGISRIAGFVRDMLTAGIIGAGPIADAFFIALRLPNLFRRITAEGAFSVSFVPLYAKTLEQEGEQGAELFSSNTFMVMLAILTVFIVVAVIFMPFILYLIAPGFADEPTKYKLALEFSRISFPYLLLISLTALIGAIMNSHNLFAPFAFVPTLFNLTLIGALFLGPYFATPGHALAWGLLVSGFVQLGFMWICLKRAGLKIVYVRPKIDKKVKDIFRLMLPGLLGAGVAQINLFMDTIIASFLSEGSISYLYYADRLNQFPLSIVGIAVGTALLPMLSRAMAKAETEKDGAVQAIDLFNRALEYCFLLALPAAIALGVIPLTLVKILFEHGAFTAEDSQGTAMVLIGYSLGLPAYIITKVFSTAHWARHDTTTPVRISIICVGSNIGIALCLIPFLGVSGIAFATGIVGWLQYYLHIRALRDHPHVCLDNKFKHNIPKITAASCLMGVVLFMLATLLQNWSYNGPMILQIMILGALVLSAGGVYAVTILYTGVVRIQDIKRYLVRSGNKGVLT